ncbi:MAG: hypothetical protein NDI84_13575 [Steroidobacteraceae bacterium]|nr:hypothetical protein [Steroidobacteraceae bacterium]
MLAAACFAALAPPVVADATGTPVAGTIGKSSVTLLPDERDEQLQPLALIAPAVLIVALSTLGLTITFRSLRADLKQRRNAYRRRRGGDSA